MRLKNQLSYKNFIQYLTARREVRFEAISYLDIKDLQSLYSFREVCEARSENGTKLIDECRPAGRLRRARVVVFSRSARGKNHQPIGYRTKPGHSFILF